MARPKENGSDLKLSMNFSTQTFGGSNITLMPQRKPGFGYQPIKRTYRSSVIMNAKKDVEEGVQNFLMNSIKRNQKSFDEIEKMQKNDESTTKSKNSEPNSS